MEELAQTVVKLEKILKVNIVAYNRSYFDITVSPQKHFCMNVKGANLTSKQVKILNYFEKKLSKFNVSLVAYEKPFKIYPQKDLIKSYLMLQKVN